MKEIQTKLSMSIIIITHDLGVVADMCDNIIVMYAGQILEEGTADDIFNRTKHPYTQKLLASVPSLEMSRDESLHSIEGTPPDLYIPPKGCSFYDRCDKAMVICKEHMPQLEDHSDSHKSRCWLNHQMATERGDIND